MSSRNGQQGLRAEQLNSPYKRTARSGSFTGTFGDKENAGAEARAAAREKLSLEIAHHLKGATSPCGRGKQQQQQQQQQLRHQKASSPPITTGLSPSLPSVFFASGDLPCASPSGSNGAATAGAVVGADGHTHVLPLSPSSTAVRSISARPGRPMFDRGTGFGSGAEPSHSRIAATRRVPVRAVRAKTGGGGGGGSAAAFTHAHAPAAMLRVPPRRPKSGSRKLLQGGPWMGMHESGGDSAPDADEMRISGNKASENAKADASAFESETPKRSRSPTAGLTLPPPTSCDEEVSRNFEAKAKRLSTIRTHGNTAGSGSGRFFASNVGVGDGEGLGDSGDGGGRGRWRKLHARGGGGSEGAPRLKLSVETAAVASGEDDEVLLSPSCLPQAGGVGFPTYSCSSPVLPLSAGGGIVGRVRDDLVFSSVDSAWSMGSIDEAAAREPTNTRLEDKICRSDPVARMLLCQSDEYPSGIGCSISIATTSNVDGNGDGGSSGSSSSSITKECDTANSDRTYKKSAPTYVDREQQQQRQNSSCLTRAAVPISPKNQTSSSSPGVDVTTVAAAAVGTPKRAPSANNVPVVVVAAASPAEANSDLRSAPAGGVAASPHAFAVAGAAGGNTAAARLLRAGSRGGVDAARRRRLFSSGGRVGSEEGMTASASAASGGGGRVSKRVGLRQ